MKRLVVLMLGLAAGFGSGWALKPSGFVHPYRTTQELRLLGNHAQLQGVLPSGSPLLSDVVLGDSVDLAWRACVPVYFDTMGDAERLGIVQGQPLTSVASFTLHARGTAGQADEP